MWYTQTHESTHFCPRPFRRGTAVVLQKILKDRRSHESFFLFSLSCYSKQAGNKRFLACTVLFVHSSHLPFPDHIHHLIPLQGSPRRLEGKESQSWFG